MKSNIYLIGFMGCGKTTIGDKLAAERYSKLIDLDKEIEYRMNQSIANLFETRGEEYFRNIESKFLLETKDMSDTVISTGGGIISKEINREFLKAQTTIYLEWDFETLYQRIKNDANRPNVKNCDQLKELYKSRISFYEEAATYKINCEGQSKKQIITNIIEWLGDR